MFHSDETPAWQADGGEKKRKISFRPKWPKYTDLVWEAGQLFRSAHLGAHAVETHAKNVKSKSWGKDQIARWPSWQSPVG